MAASAILKIQKSRYLGNGLTDRHEIWHGYAHWPSEVRTGPALKISNFLKSKMTDGRHLEK